MREVADTPCATVLLADADPVVLLILEAALAGEGFRVVLATNEEQVSRLASNQSLSVDAALLALTLPGKGSLELGSRLRQLNPHLRVLFHHASTDGLALRIRMLNCSLGVPPSDAFRSGPVEAVAAALAVPAEQTFIPPEAARAAGLACGL